MKCTKCGAEIPNGAHFCGECGATQQNEGAQQGGNVYGGQAYGYNNGEPPQICSRCGSRVEAGKTFCPSCGQRMYAVPPINPYGHPAPQPKRDNALVAVILGIVGLLIVVAVVIIAVVLINNGNKPEVQNTSSFATAAPLATAAPQPTAVPQPTAAPVQQIPPAAPPQNNTARAVPANSDYLFPSDSVYITDADLYGRSRDEVRLIINEIYARHGYIFSTQSYQNYFASKSWYVPITKSQSDVESWFNSIELANKNFLSNYEKQRGWR